MSLDSTFLGGEAGAERVSFARTAIEHIADVALQPSVRGAVAALRQLFRVEVAYATRHNATHQVLEAVEGDGGSFGITDGEAIPLADSESSPAICLRSSAMCGPNPSRHRCG
jgi:hypothetical protein